MSQAVGNVNHFSFARVWHHVDASDRVLGKLAERIALKVKVTGKKEEQLVYRKHTIDAYKTMQERKPDEIIRQAVSGISSLGVHMGIVGGNIMKSWEDGSLPTDFKPSTQLRPRHWSTFEPSSKPPRNTHRFTFNTSLFTI
ncbi:hypothetical protein BKA70DRAFT_1263742, partial [Coprinopsis sp. MPI-PUGE-AT-0042]